MMHGLSRRFMAYASIICAVLLIETFLHAAYAAQDYDAAIKARSSVLDSVRSELERGRKKISELRAKEGTAKAQLDVLERNLGTAEHLIKGISANIDDATEQLAQLRDSLDNTKASLGRAQERMRARLRSMYMTGMPSLIQIIGTASSITDVVHKARYFQELREFDRRLITIIDEKRKIVEVATQTVKVHRDTLLALRGAREHERQGLVAEERVHRDILVKVKGEKEAYISMVKELEASQKELAKIIKALAEKRKKASLTKRPVPSGTGFSAKKGNLPWPVDGTQLTKFGKIVHPVYKTITMNVGIDISAKTGTQVICVAPGQVDYIGWMRGYGNFVIVNHADDFVSIYARLDNVTIETDQKVVSGSVLGTVAETAEGEKPCLQFQLRHATIPVNPMEWLTQKVR